MISQETLAICAATVVGPVAAVLITRWNDARSARRERRFAIFRTLMATRKIAISPEHVQSINLIEVEFHGVSKVIDAWNTYIHHLNHGLPTETPSNDQQKAFDERRSELLALLLARIAEHLRIAKGEIEILRGGYAPDGWRVRESLQSIILQYLADIGMGRAVVPMTIGIPTVNQSKFPPPPPVEKPTALPQPSSGSSE